MRDKRLLPKRHRACSVYTVQRREALMVVYFAEPQVGPLEASSLISSTKTSDRCLRSPPGLTIPGLFTTILQHPISRFDHLCCWSLRKDQGIMTREGKVLQPVCHGDSTHTSFGKRGVLWGASPRAWVSPLGIYKGWGISLWVVI